MLWGNLVRVFYFILVKTKIGRYLPIICYLHLIVLISVSLRSELSYKLGLLTDNERDKR